MQGTKESILETSFPSASPLEYHIGGLLTGCLSPGLAFFFLWITQALISISLLGIFLTEISHPHPLPPDLYELLNSAINYCFMTRWKVLSFVLSSDFFSWLKEMIGITFSSPREDKLDFDKGQEKRIGGREIHLLSPLALLVAFWKIKICWNKEFFKIAHVRGKNISCISKSGFFFFPFL